MSDKKLQDEAPQPPRSVKTLQPGRIVVFTDSNGTRHPAVVTKLGAPGPRNEVTVASFGVNRGDEPAGMEYDVRHDSQGGPQSWSWPDELKDLPSTPMPGLNELIVQQ